jgi:hypothetical protein
MIIHTHAGDPEKIHVPCGGDIATSTQLVINHSKIKVPINHGHQAHKIIFFQTISFFRIMLITETWDGGYRASVPTQTTTGKASPMRRGQTTPEQ